MSIVAVLQGSPETDTLTTLSALAMARQLNVPLTGLCALPDPQSAMMVVSTPESAGLSAAAVTSIIEMQKEVLAKAQGAFRDVTGAGAHGIDCTFVHQVGTVETAAAGAATLADALVFPRSASKPAEPLSIAFDHVMMDARLPVVLAGNTPFTPGPVIIGWDGSNGAARAVRFHVPLIAVAGDVIIAQNTKDAQREGVRQGSAPDALAAWLKHRGVKARTETFEGEVGAGLLRLAASTGATLMVAGAYGHSRLGERLFGGTSRKLLTTDAAPALALSR